MRNCGRVQPTGIHDDGPVRVSYADTDAEPDVEPVSDADAVSNAQPEPDADPDAVADGDTDADGSADHRDAVSYGATDRDGDTDADGSSDDRDAVSYSATDRDGDTDADDAPHRDGDTISQCDCYSATDTGRRGRRWSLLRAGGHSRAGMLGPTLRVHRGI